MLETTIDKVRNQHNALNYTADVTHNLNVIKTGKGELKIPLIDIYVNQMCNLRCSFCINGTNFFRSNIPMESINIIKKLNPRMITLTGGGEPSIYNYKGYRIHDYIKAIKTEIGNIPIGMMTNGVVQLHGSAQENLSWIRVSLNASNKESYESIHKRDQFENVIKNIIRYCEGPITHVGVGFVYTLETSKDLFEFVKLIFEQVYRKLSYINQQKLTIQFRPVADADYNRISIPLDLRDAYSKEIANSSLELREFIKNNTNLCNALENRIFQNKFNFNKCYMSLLQMNIDSEGNTFPCPQKTHANVDSYGNLFSENFLVNLNEQIKQSFITHTCKVCDNCAQQEINSLYERTNYTSIPNGDTSVFF
ncbi:radical SAM protein [Bacillus pseudomycoides]|uniref:radical SAM protein n=1 Tax=Bacillus pseudomycoides TaxID=64104 RepID=UPI000BF897D6|nr:radical SAM protein [Bacillus pseudomycoides]PGD73704.1 hypothetical protein COM46_21740 [Bacillus pseudomycoides]